MPVKNNMENKFQSKKAVSAVVTTMILIIISLAAVAVIWIAVNSIVKEGLENVQSCVDVIDKVQINELYTCYNSTGDEIWISISIGDIEVDNIIVSVSGGGTTGSFELSSTPGTITGLKNYSDGGSIVFLPKENAGLTYIYDTSSIPGTLDLLEIIPVIKGSQCGVSDSLSDFSSCSSII